MLLPLPQVGLESEWVERHLAGLYSGQVVASARFTGTQRSADEALARLDLTGYASSRNEVWPESRRGATALSPFIRHGLLPLPWVWSQATGAENDLEAFRSELLWQEYARHLYATIGAANRTPLRYEAPAWKRHAEPDAGTTDFDTGIAWDTSMRCIALALEELTSDGWIVNQARMWLASQWTVRSGANWLKGEDFFFSHLLDGSRAANRLGWQWTIGTATGRQYGFAREQVERRAPGCCASCTHQHHCPIETWPETQDGEPVHPTVPLMASPDAVGGSATPIVTGAAEAIWITAESLGDRDPALQAETSLPVVFVFDEPLLARLQLSAKRLVFITQRLAELAAERAVEIHRGSIPDSLGARPLAVTSTPVPGWRSRARHLEIVSLHPWPWLRRPGGKLTSYSAWRRAIG